MFSQRAWATEINSKLIPWVSKREKKKPSYKVTKQKACCWSNITFCLLLIWKVIGYNSPDNNWIFQSVAQTVPKGISVHGVKGTVNKTLETKTGKSIHGFCIFVCIHHVANSFVLFFKEYLTIVSNTGLINVIEPFIVLSMQLFHRKRNREHWKDLPISSTRSPSQAFTLCDLNHHMLL